MDLYFASSKDLETIDCVLDFQKTSESPIKMLQPVIDLRVFGHETQSKFEKPLMCSSKLDENRSVLPSSFF